MKKSRLLSGALVWCFMPPLANAAIVNYLIEGDLYLSNGTDVYNLDGAHFLWTITADTASYHLLPVGGDAHGRIVVHYESLNTLVEVTNRSNGASDAVVTGTLPLLMTANANLGSPPPADLFETRFSYLNGELSGLAVGAFWLNFGADFYYDNGVAPLPESLDYTQAVASGWGGFIADTPTYIRYGVSSWSMHVQAVPIPAAIWLFASGLLGLVGVARKPVRCR